MSTSRSYLYPIYLYRFLLMMNKKRRIKQKIMTMVVVLMFLLLFRAAGTACAVVAEYFILQNKAMQPTSNYPKLSCIDDLKIQVKQRTQTLS